VNGCDYCIAAHTAIGQSVGFSEQETLDIRSNNVSDEKLAALIGFAKSVTENRGKATDESIETFLNSGYERKNLIDVLATIADKTFVNYINIINNTPIDFPEAKSIELATA
jgi:alkylhydroperoxidase family enzyme